MGKRRNGLTLNIDEQYEQAAMADVNQIIDGAASCAERFPRKKTIQRLDAMVDYSVTDQEELEFAFMTPEGGYRIAKRCGFDLYLADHDDPNYPPRLESFMRRTGVTVSVGKYLVTAALSSDPE